MKLIKQFFLCSAILFFSGCTTLQQDVIMNTSQEIQIEDVQNIERLLCQADAQNILGNSSSAEIKKLTEKIHLLITDSIAELGLNNAVLSRLYALEGRTFLLEGNKTNAKACYLNSLKTYKGDSQTYILGNRLEVVTLDDENIISGSNQSNLLTLEIALTNYKKGLFDSSVASFDEAFISLPEYYKNAYLPLRNKAWELRNIADVSNNSSIVKILQKQQITLGEMLLITQENSNLLYVITGGKKLSETDLFNKVLKAGLFNPAFNSANESEYKEKLSKSSTATKSLCARFFWNIWNLKNGTLGELTKYSQAFAQVEESPVQDVAVTDKDFDAILGCIENEFIELTDGINFFPKQTPSAASFNTWIQKIK